ncbi:MAG: homoserine dehydrogenase [Opitutales bacterium]|jgi:homoserine dehydrogenase|nr:homoserine dehydrogenase [Opitutales bacterium]MDP4644373.1 homoserine dehydrogenase [Opitutales bacterium]MDP4777839.1 homoserine dehydrogenase [Opitutales bacterium]MDP4884371.1 homoserine dehydrogenase [Opitutales bacterium]MDP5079872.1 homoserine dehydrogenase [Opitutales bacterium]
MSEKRTIRIGLLGFGVVGQGVWKNIEKNRQALELRLGAQLDITEVVVKNLGRERDVEVPAERISNVPARVVENPDVDIVCELMGGTDEALVHTRRALELGKIVVTANKALICEHGEELFDIARRTGGHYFYEASVAGGIPIIKTIREALVANRFKLIFGILNGTSNYILTRMEREGLSFDETLGDARKLGYVEADEALDLDGIDAAHKAVILAYLAHGKWVKLNEIICEGIRDITGQDIAIAGQLGYKIKLLAVIARDFEADKLSVRLHPALISKKEVIAGVDEVYNGVSVTGDVVGTTVLIGRGAGQDATSSSVISDIADAVFMLQGAPAPAICEEDEKIYNQLAEGLELATPGELSGRYYLRIHVKDQEGVLAKISNILAEHHISFATVNQQELEDGSALIMVTTHTSNEAAIADAKVTLAAEPVVLSAPVSFRIFDPNKV